MWRWIIPVELEAWAELTSQAPFKASLREQHVVEILELFSPVGSGLYSRADKYVEKRMMIFLTLAE